MKYTSKEYAAAFLSAFLSAPAGERDVLIRRFAKVIHRHGDSSRSKQIIQAIRRALVEKRGGRMITVEYARPVSQQQEEKIKKNFTGNDVIETKINPALLAGVRIIVDGEKELDNSARHKLQQL